MYKGILYKSMVSINVNGIIFSCIHSSYLVEIFRILVDKPSAFCYAVRVKCVRAQSIIDHL